jgi:hypothetical protein
MGWCSGTIIFDDMVEALLYPGRVDKKETIKRLIKTLWNADWDCEFDSSYITHPLVKEAFAELEPDMKRDIEEHEEWLNEVKK